MSALTSARSTARLIFDAAAGGLVTLVWLLLVVPLSRARRWRRRPPRVLWGPVPIPNIVYSARADRLAGFVSRTLVYAPYRISERESFDHVFDRIARVPGFRRFTPYAAFLWAAGRADIYGFFFDGGLLQATPWWRWELRLLRLAGKEVVVYPYGSDARLPSATRRLGRWNLYADISPEHDGQTESVNRARRSAFARYATVMLGCADIVDLPRLDGIFLYPFDLDGWHARPEVDDGIVTVVHAPNHRHFKGTRFLVHAIDQLQREGMKVELRLVEGLKTSEARPIYESADVIADQFLIGAYALFAIEGMALGKPVICYLNDEFRRHHPEWSECPIVSANPDELLGALRRLVESGDLRRRIGSLGPAYVREYHSLEASAARMASIYGRIW